MTSTVFYLSVMAAMMATCNGHLCLISPPQRGSMMGLNKPASPDCILLTAPCGGRKENEPTLSIKAGSEFTVTMQKNLDHYNASSPVHGYFSVTVMNEADSKELFKVADTSEPSLTLISANVTLPSSKGRVTLQARYVTNNPKAPPVFYQCRDLNLH